MATTESAPETELPTSDEGASPPTVPEVVYHYTSLDTMMKIVEHRQIWATALPYLNDSKERTFLFEAVKMRLPQLKADDPSLDPDLDLSFPGPTDPRTITSFADEAFVACFAEHGDSLMHWRAYCPQQSGVAIGFRTRCLSESEIAEKRAAGMIVPPVRFSKVGYIDSKDTKTVDSVIRYAYATAQKEVARGRFPGSLNDHFRWTLDYIGVMHKEKSFEVEDEFRLLLSNVRYREVPNLKFRTVRSTMVPYVPLYVPGVNDQGILYEFENKQVWNAIESVIVGPTANMDLTVRSVEAFFAMWGERNVRILPSTIPYREW